MEYRELKGTTVQEAAWDEGSCVVRQGGYSIDKTNLPASLIYLPKGAPMAIKNDKAILVKTAVAQAQALSSATTLKVEKGHLFAVGDTIAGSKISKIDTSNEAYDALTVASLGAQIEVGQAIADANAKDVIGLNYATVKIDAAPSCAITLQAYEIEEDSLPYALSEEIKAALTSRHAFKV